MVYDVILPELPILINFFHFYNFYFFLKKLFFFTATNKILLFHFFFKFGANTNNIIIPSFHIFGGYMERETSFILVIEFFKIVKHVTHLTFYV